VRTGVRRYQKRASGKWYQALLLDAFLCGFIFLRYGLKIASFSAYLLGMMPYKHNCKKVFSEISACKTLTNQNTCSKINAYNEII